MNQRKEISRFWGQVFNSRDKLHSGSPKADPRTDFNACSLFGL